MCSIPASHAFFGNIQISWQRLKSKLNFVIMLTCILVKKTGTWKKYSKTSRIRTKPTKWPCAQRRLRSAWASTQSDQTLRCALNGWLRTQAFFMWTAKTLIRLGGCPFWSESSLGARSLCWFCRCPDWSESSLSAHPFCWFCHEVAQTWNHKTYTHRRRPAQRPAPSSSSLVTPFPFEIVWNVRSGYISPWSLPFHIFKAKLVFSTLPYRKNEVLLHWHFNLTWKFGNLHEK